MTDHKGLPVHRFAAQAAFAGWLAEHGATSPGAWLQFAKQGSGETTLGKAEAVEAALMHGWVDGQLDRFDERFWLVRFTRRKPKSRWSEVNRELATRLLAEGRMTPAGLAEVERAKQDGRWAAAYAPQSRAEVPADLQAALAAEPVAAAFFATLTAVNRYAVIHRVITGSARTRAGRIARFVAMLARGESVYPQASRDRGV